MTGGHGPGRPHHRPSLYADLTEVIDAAGGTDPTRRAEVAAATAAVLVDAGRGADEGPRAATPDPDGAERFVALADRVGIDTLAALWHDADPVSLPGALWALYLLRQWSRTDSDEVARLWRAGEGLAPAEAAVAGVADLADADAVRRVADAVLAGVYRGDLAVALERAAAVFRVIAAGRRFLAPAGGAQDDALALAARNDDTARALSAAAARWRAGTLH